MLILAVFFISLWNIKIALSRNPLLLVSFDGMRSDKFESFVKDNPSSTFNKFLQSSLKAEYMMPSFPSLTFPNHLTLVTGLNPESHGIVNNGAYDPILKVKTRFTSTIDVQWFNTTEPIWLTAKRQGLKTASSFWAGSNIFPRTPDMYLPYVEGYNLIDRMNEVVSWFKKFDIDFLNIYFDQPDLMGHAFGPDSKEYLDKIFLMDSTLGYLFSELDRVNILNKLNIIVLGDHGMAPLTGRKYVFIQDHVDINLIDQNKSYYGVVSSVYPSSNQTLIPLYESMLKLPNIKVYLKENVPEEYYYRNNIRIGPIVAIADEGVRLTNDKNIEQESGAHGYNNSLPSMRTIFMAKGPSFKQGTIPPFRNVNIYPLMCKLIGIKCNPNNGTTTIFEPYLVNDNSFMSYIYQLIENIIKYFKN